MEKERHFDYCFGIVMFVPREILAEIKTLLPLEADFYRTDLGAASVPSVFGRESRNVLRLFLMKTIPKQYAS